MNLNRESPVARTILIKELTYLPVFSFKLYTNSFIKYNTLSPILGMFNLQNEDQWSANSTFYEKCGIRFSMTGLHLPKPI
jgi:hypothetical protein